MSSSARAGTRLFGFFLVLLLVVPGMLLLNALKHPARIRLARASHSVFRRIFGVDVVVRGQMSARRPTLFAANHTSYLDIIVLGGLIDGSFVAKKEIAGWPIFGFLANLQRTIYVERRARHASGQRDALAARLQRKENVILFPEGTSSDGTRVKPFKSALFGVAEAAAEGQALLVQPVSITYTRLDGIPLGRHLRPLIAWYGDMHLVPHVWVLLGLGRLTVAVDFHEPLTLAAAGSRKVMADACARAVARGVAAALAGREAVLPAPDAALPAPQAQAAV